MAASNSTSISARVGNPSISPRLCTARLPIQFARCTASAKLWCSSRALIIPTAKPSPAPTVSTTLATGTRTSLNGVGGTAVDGLPVTNTFTSAWGLYILSLPSANLLVIVGLIVAYAGRGGSDGLSRAHIDAQIGLFWSVFWWTILLWIGIAICIVSFFAAPAMGVILTGGSILMSGPAAESYRGTFDWDDYAVGAGA